MRIAALSTNLGWAPGAIVMSASDYARAWGSTAASAYEVLLAPDAPAARVGTEVERALRASGQTGLTVRSAAVHAAAQRALSSQALARLSQIANVILLASALAMSAAMGALVWQRRPRLAALKLEGLARRQLWQRSWRFPATWPRAYPQPSPCRTERPTHRAWVMP